MECYLIGNLRLEFPEDTDKKGVSVCHQHSIVPLNVPEKRSGEVFVLALISAKPLFMLLGNYCPKLVALPACCPRPLHAFTKDCHL